VLAISTDNQPTLNHWAGELKADYPLLSDFMRKVSASYGVLVPERGIAARTTFVVDPEGKIQHIEEGSAAMDPTGAATACSRIKKK
jgi:alkyl hydroperoxide reductase subunit AhpC